MKISHYLRNILLGSVAAIVLTTVAHAADPAGNWTWSTPGRNGGADHITTLTLKVEDAKLTGKISAPGRDGTVAESPIADGKIDGDNISFVLVRSFNGNSSTNTYTGTVSADKITGKIGFVRNGEAQSRNWEAKRAPEAK